MKISIVTACFNAVGTIRTAMESVARQRGVELEHIVVDGGSTDGTVEAVREKGISNREQGIRKKEEVIRNKEQGIGNGIGNKEEGIRNREEGIGNGEQGIGNGEDGIGNGVGNGDGKRGYVFRWMSEKDRGLYDAINKGIRMATGDVVGILNADDALDGDDVLARIAEEFQQADGEVDCVYGKVRFVKGERESLGDGGESLGDDVERLRKRRTVRRCFAKLWRPWMLQWGYMPPHPGIFIRRERFAQWGYYEPDRREYRIAADYELLIRYFRVRRMRAKYTGICTTVMRTGGVSTRDVNARRILNEEIIKANRANGYFCCWPMLLPKYAIKVWEVILPLVSR